MKRLRVGVIGAGTVSQVEHIPNPPEHVPPATKRCWSL